VDPETEARAGRIRQQLSGDPGFHCTVQEKDPAAPAEQGGTREAEGMEPGGVLAGGGGAAAMRAWTGRWVCGGGVMVSMWGWWGHGCASQQACSGSLEKPGKQATSYRRAVLPGHDAP
jgi:hypothetical protein